MYGKWRTNWHISLFGDKGGAKEEAFGLTSQLRRAALSIPTNIVEGYSGKGDKTLSHFLNISFASLAETNYLLYFSNRLKYLDDTKRDELKRDYDIPGTRLWKLYDKVRKTINSTV